MAYQTGGGGGVADFVAALNAFAVSNGWSNVGIGPLTGGGYCLLEKGNCHVAFQYFTTTTVTAYTQTGGSAISVPNHMIYATVNRSLDPTKQQYWGHPGYPKADATRSYNFSALINDLTGPLVAWHFFTNATGDYIHAAINTQADRWTHFAFGNIDKGTFSHSGGAYVTGTNNNWWRESNVADPSNTSYYYYNRPNTKIMPFTGWNSSLYAPDAGPSGFTDIIINATDGTSNSLNFPTMQCRNGPDSFPQNSFTARLLDHVVAAHVPSWSGNVPLYGSPAFVNHATDGRIYPLGMYPDVRLMNMEGMLPGQEINLSGDVWKVFPLQRQESWSASGTQFVCTSGQYAVAYKKIA